MEVKTYPQCFACGLENPYGLRLVFEVEPEGRARTAFEAKPHHEGYPEIVHGGILTTLADETMAKAVQGLGVLGVTANLEVRFRQPAPVGKRLDVDAWVEGRRGRRVETRAQVTTADGQLLTEAQGVFVLVADED